MPFYSNKGDEFKGKMEEKRQNALVMLREGLAVELIAKVTKLCRNKIEDLRGTL